MTLKHVKTGRPGAPSTSDASSESEQTPVTSAPSTPAQNTSQLLDPISSTKSSPQRKKKGKRGKRLYKLGDGALAAAAAAKSEQMKAGEEEEPTGKKRCGNWRRVSLAGGAFVDTPVVFSLDTSTFFCITGARVKVHSAKTGLALRTLQSTSELPNIRCTAVNLDPENGDQIYSAATDGVISLWNFRSGSLVQQWNTGSAILDMKISPASSRHAFLVCTRNKFNPSTPSRHVLARYNFKQGKKSTILQLHHEFIDMDMARDGRLLSIASRDTAWVVSCEEPHNATKCPSPSQRIPLSSVAMHPKGEFIAVGDLMGQITLVHVPSMLSGEHVARSVLHWHSHRVSGMVFTPDGEYLLSGGNEAVLVIWQLNTRDKQFLPRLGSAIRTVAVSADQSVYAVTHTDNSMRLVEAANLRQRFLLAGLPVVDAVGAPEKGWKMTTDANNNAVVLYGRSGKLHFYDVDGDKRIQEIEITPSNAALALRKSESSAIVANVSHVALTADSTWMLTVDERSRPSVALPFESRLKFWKYDPNAGTYLISTRVDRPHDGEVTAAAMGPKSLQPLRAATAGRDRCFRVWRLSKVAGDEEASEEDAWTCHFSGSYRNMMPTSVSFSSDGSLISVAFEQTITLWDCAGSILQSVLTSPSQSPLSRVDFLAGSSYLLTSSDTHIHVWNLLTGTLWWTVCINSSHIAIDTQDARFAVLFHTSPSHDTTTTPFASHIALFDADSPTPLATFSSAASPGPRAATFLPPAGKEQASKGRRGKSRLVVLDGGAELELFAEEEMRLGMGVKAPNMTAAREKNLAPTGNAWSALYGTSTSDLHQTRLVPTSIVTTTPDAPLSTTTPSHIHPPPSRFFMSVMEAFLPVRRETGMDSDPAVDMEEHPLESTTRNAKDWVKTGACDGPNKHGTAVPLGRTEEVKIEAAFRRLLGV
ncbi:WD40-repeat-containing domain protein [Fimicolochytrium jonesii]|uniref:WD40-repeat-containing domain protein n=1 Tax=Fimicolochytrium jonesii TaxID=1396493 RepID=UPI0022FF43D0|nr:WD40-repeat-containing domain protein [Fimicolochytrium jonesii]KAI8816204.1 WD40-repeat-containing domain protein [Fimicolochytrium jonesii]